MTAKNKSIPVMYEETSNMETSTQFSSRVVELKERLKIQHKVGELGESLQTVIANNVCMLQ